MTIEDTIKTVLASMQGKLIDAGHSDEAKDPALLKTIEDALRARLTPPPLTTTAVSPVIPPPPSLANVATDLDEVAKLLRQERDDPPEIGCYCSVFLGAAAHYGPPKYLRQDGTAQPAYQNGPLGAAELAKVLSDGSEFPLNFPNENAWDLMRVSTWFQSDHEHGRRGLEDAIKAAVETGKTGSEMITQIASWPCRTYYTTNYDTHLEKALLERHQEVFIWIYRPTAVNAPGGKAGRETYDLRTHWWRMTKDPKHAGNYLYERWTGTKDASSGAAPAVNLGTVVASNAALQQSQTGQSPPEPPAKAVVVCKLHGDLRERGSVVITDEDYTKFLCRFAKAKLPNRLLLPLQSTVLFIGYSLRDYNMRYVLTSLREELDSAWSEMPTSYSVDLRPDPLLKATWQKNNLIFFLEHNLWDIVPAITQRL